MGSLEVIGGIRLVSSLEIEVFILDGKYWN